MYILTDLIVTGVANMTGLNAEPILPSKTSVSLPGILRQITLEEFLQAVERVKAAELLSEHFNETNYIEGNFGSTPFCKRKFYLIK